MILKIFVYKVMSFLHKLLHKFIKFLGEPTDRKDHFHLNLKKTQY